MAFFFAGLLNRQLCEYLTCERYEEFVGVPQFDPAFMPQKRRLEAYLLMGSLVCGLGVVLVVIYYVVWLCFWQMEGQGPMKIDHQKNLPRLFHPNQSAAVKGSNVSFSRPNHLPVFTPQERDWRRNANVNNGSKNPDTGPKAF